MQTCSHAWHARGLLCYVHFISSTQAEVQSCYWQCHMLLVYSYMMTCEYSGGQPKSKIVAFCLSTAFSQGSLSVPPTICTFWGPSLEDEASGDLVQANFIVATFWGFPFFR